MQNDDQTCARDLDRHDTRYYGERAGFLAALALNLTGYYGLAASTFALPDGPLLFFWLLTMDRLSLAMKVAAPHSAADNTDSRFSPSETGAGGLSLAHEGGARECAGERMAEARSRRRANLLPWAWVGVAWGAAMLSKYHGIFLPMGAALYALLHRPARRWLAHPGPYVATVVGMLIFSPVIVWNATHGWASFLFQGGRAVGGTMLRPDQLMLALVAQAMYLFPWIWVPLVAIVFIGCRNWRRSGDVDRLWLALAVGPLAVFTVVACFRPVLPHWGLIGLVSIFPVLGQKWSERLQVAPRRTRRLLVAYAGFSVAFLAFTIVEYRYGILQRDRDGRSGLIDASRDPTLDLYGWDQVARKIHALGVIEKPGTFLFTRFWYQSAQLAHALDGKYPVLCYNTDDPRGFAFWSKPDDWVGHDGILVVVGEHEAMARYYRRWFAQVEPVSDFYVERQGKIVRQIGIYRCVRQRVPYPFTRDSETRLARNGVVQ
jgi:4-amino-4-deoxy-L-arabinose transferase-like glycosyltransferase